MLVPTDMVDAYGDRAPNSPGLTVTRSCKSSEDLE